MAISRENLGKGRVRMKKRPKTLGICGLLLLPSLKPLMFFLALMDQCLRLSLIIKDERRSRGASRVRERERVRRHGQGDAGCMCVLLCFGSDCPMPRGS